MTNQLNQLLIEIISIQAHYQMLMERYDDLQIKISLLNYINEN